jgi:CRISPR-associated endoribonuclease Cas6
MTCGKWWNGQKRFELTPDPVLIWHGVRRQWGLCGGLDPGKAYDTWVEQSVGLIACDIKTRLLHYPDYDQVGFEGWAQFRAVSRDRESLVFWRTLADFAFYAGVGYKTSMGMGQTGVKDG